MRRDENLIQNHLLAYNGIISNNTSLTLNLKMYTFTNEMNLLIIAQGDVSIIRVLHSMVGR